MKSRFVPLVLAILCAACLEDPVASTRLEQRVFTLLGGLEPGQVLTFSGSEVDSIFLAGGPEGQEYMFIPFLAADTPGVRLTIEVQGDRLIPPQSGLPSLGSAPALRGLVPFSPEQFHLRLREWERSRVQPLLRRGLGTRGERALERRTTVQLADVPRTGDTVTVRVPNFDSATGSPCDDPVMVRARVVAVTARAILLVDVNSPTGGVAEADLQRIAREYDELVYPVAVENFREPTDIDDNDRVIILVTPEVNRRTPPGSESFVAGFTFLLDLLPRSIPELNFECPASSEGEIFYIVAPDPTGQVSVRLSTELVTRIATGIIGHELEHVINFGRRVYLVQGAEELEITWLDEALAHMAQELMFYRASGLGPRMNLTLDRIRSPGVFDPFIRFQEGNIANYAAYIEDPEDESLMGIEPFDDDLPTRGGGWAFLRYLADQTTSEDAALFRALVNSQVAGVRNINRAIDGGTGDWMQRFTVAVFTDDHIERVDSIYQHPSWNYRSVIPIFRRWSSYPLEVHELDPDGELSLVLRGGGASYVRLRVQEGRQGLIRTTTMGDSLPSAVRGSVVRVR